MHPTNKRERRKEQDMRDKKFHRFTQSWEWLKHQAEYAVKKLKPTRRQQKGMLSEKEQLNLYEEENESIG